MAHPHSGGNGSSRPLRVGLIGLGITGRVHLRNLQAMPEVEVVAVAESNPGVTVEGAPPIRREDDYQALIASGDLDAVVISLPHFLHADCAGLALRGGLDVFLEKPIATNYDEAAALVECARETGRTLMVNMTHRFYPPMQKARELLDSGAIGAIVSVRDHYMEVIDRRDFPGWFFDPVAAGGGVAITDSVHLIDRVEWLLGGPLELVGGTGRTMDAESEVEDCVEFLCRTSAGIPVSIGSFFCFSGERTFADGLTIFGTRGTLSAHAWSHVDLAVYGRPTQRFSGYPEGMPQADRVALGHRAAMTEFVRALREKRPTGADAGAVLNAQRLVQEFYETRAECCHEPAGV